MFVYVLSCTADAVMRQTQPLFLIARGGFWCVLMCGNLHTFDGNFSSIFGFELDFGLFSVVQMACRHPKQVLLLLNPSPWVVPSG